MENVDELAESRLAKVNIAYDIIGIILIASVVFTSTWYAVTYFIELSIRYFPLWFLIFHYPNMTIVDEVLFKCNVIQYNAKRFITRKAS